MARISARSGERGGALAYALLVFLMLSIAVAVVVGYLSNSKVNERKDLLERKANAMAVGGMETFLAYLRAYEPSMGISPNEYVGRFADDGLAEFRWGDQDQDGLFFRSPEGEEVRLLLYEREDEYESSETPEGWDKMTVVCRAQIRSNSRSSMAEISYVFHTTDQIPAEGGGGPGGGSGPAPETNVSTDPEVRICTDRHYNIYYQGEFQLDGSKYTKPAPADSGSTSINAAIDQAISEYQVIMEDKRQEVLAEIQQAAAAHALPPANERFNCSPCNNAADLKAVIDSAADATDQRPIPVRVPNWLNLQGAPVVLGEPGKEVALIGNLNVSTDVKIYGDLFTDGINFNGGSTFEVTGHLNSTAVLQTRDGLHLKAGSIAANSGLTVRGPLTVQGDIYSRGNVTQSGNYPMTFRHLYTDGELQIGSNPVDASGTIYAAQHMLIGSTASFQAEHVLAWSKLTLKGSALNVDGRLFVGPYGNTNATAEALNVDTPKPTVNAGFFLVNGKMQSNNAFEVNISGGVVDGETITPDFIARSALMSSSGTTINTDGDFLVQTSLESNGGFDLDIGGRLAFGTKGRFNGNISTIVTGGEPSSFFLEGEINPCAGGGDPFSFNPIRVS